MHSCISAFSHLLATRPQLPTDYSLENPSDLTHSLTLWQPDLSLPRTIGFHAALVNKLVPCAWLLSGALEVWSLRLRLRWRIDLIVYDKSYRKQEHVKAIVSNIGHSKLDYCNSLFLSLDSTQIHRLQRIQNSLARAVTRTPRHHHIHPVPKSLHWLKIPERIHFKVLSLTYNSLQSSQPTHLRQPLPLPPTPPPPPSPPPATPLAPLIFLPPPSPAPAPSFPLLSPRSHINHCAPSLESPTS